MNLDELSAKLERYENVKAEVCAPLGLCAKNDDRHGVRILTTASDAFDIAIADCRQRINHEVWRIGQRLKLWNRMTDAEQKRFKKKHADIYKSVMADWEQLTRYENKQRKEGT